MNQSFYTAAVGASQQMLRLNIQGNNIANVNTYGFKAEKARFTALMYQTMLGAENAEMDDLPYGVGTRLLMTSTDFTQGSVADTGRPQDYMIEGEGFFAVVDLTTGEVAFTRNGAFSMAEYLRDSGAVDEEGNPVMEKVFMLSDEEGRFVLSQEGGMIEVTDPSARYPVGVFDYSNYDGMLKISDTRFLPVDKNGNLWLGTGTVRQGVLELSNTDLAEELTKVIEAQLAYGLALKMVQTSDEIETTINNLHS